MRLRRWGRGILATAMYNFTAAKLLSVDVIFEEDLKTVKTKGVIGRVIGFSKFNPCFSACRRSRVTTF